MLRQSHETPAPSWTLYIDGLHVLLRIGGCHGKALYNLTNRKAAVFTV